MIDPDEVTELASEIRSNKASIRCQCDVEFGECPGVINCPNSDYQGDEDEN